MKRTRCKTIYSGKGIIHPMLQELNCPTCGAPGLEIHQPDGIVLCKFCGNKYSQTDDVACPRCESINKAEVLFCKQCGEKLKRTCAACSTENWAGAEYCSACGRDLDTINFMANRTREGYEDHLQKQRDMATRLKEEQEAGSQARLAAMWEIDRQRTEELQRKLEKQKAENKTLMTMMFIVGGIFLCVIVVGVIGVSFVR